MVGGRSLSGCLFSLSVSLHCPPPPVSHPMNQPHPKTLSVRHATPTQNAKTMSCLGRTSNHTGGWQVNLGSSRQPPQGLGMQQGRRLAGRSGPSLFGKFGHQNGGRHSLGMSPGNNVWVTAMPAHCSAISALSGIGGRHTAFTPPSLGNAKGRRPHTHGGMVVKKNEWMGTHESQDRRLGTEQVRLTWA